MLLMSVLLLAAPISSPQVMGGPADVAVLQVVVDDASPPYSPLLVTQEGGGGANFHQDFS